MTTSPSPTAFSVKGKTAIVTGAGSGINLAFTTLLLSLGCNVLLADLTLRPEAATLVHAYSTPNTSPRAVFQKTDVRDWTQLAAMFTAAERELGEIDIVVPGAGVYDPAWSNFWHPPGSEASGDAVEGGRYATVDINAVHPMRCAQMGISTFLAQRSMSSSSSSASPRPPKRILLISSIAGQTSTLHTPLYVASKHALNGFIRCLSPLEPRYNIRVNAVAPGVIRTPLWTEHPEKLRFFDEQADEWASAEEVARAMVRLLESEEVELGGGCVLEVGREQTRVVGQFMDPGPRGRGHSVGRAVEAYGDVYGVLEGEGWGKIKAKL